MAQKYINEYGEVLGPRVTVSGTTVDAYSDTARAWRAANGFVATMDVEELPDSSDIESMSVRERTKVLKSIIKIAKG